MKAAQQKSVDELRMSMKKFDKIMSRALQVAPPATKSKKSGKAKSGKKK